MFTKNNNAFITIFIATTILSFLFSGCTPGQGSSTTLTVPPMTAQADTAIPTLDATTTPVSTPTLMPTSALTPLPDLKLNPGDSYFSIDGTQRFIFSRNLAGTTPADYDKLLDLAQNGGTLLVRVGTDNGAMGGSYGYGYTPTGEIRDDWSIHWETFFETAEAKGIYVLPFFTGWMNWNTSDPNTWIRNPFNSVNGGPAKTPSEFYRKDSPTQKLYLEWFKNVVTRWQKHRNIAAWEVITEVNNINGISEKDGVYLFEQLAKVARAADPRRRPISASLADIGEWPSFYSDKALDILDYHPYPYAASLDLGTKLLSDTSRFSTKYKKPIIIGESGLNALPPDSDLGSGNLPNAQIGIKHAIWSEIVSGTMNGRALFWEDSYGMYFTSLGWPYLEKYAEIELPAAKFVNEVDFTGFKRLTADPSKKITGAVLGNEKMVIGWYRDVTSEPPKWNQQSIVSKETVDIGVPGSAANWKVDFYNTKTGTDIISSIMVTRSGDKVTIALPDFTDDIAFKMVIQK